MLERMAGIPAPRQLRSSASRPPSSRAPTRTCRYRAIGIGPPMPRPFTRDRMNVLAVSSGIEETVGAEGTPCSVLHQVLLDVRQIEGRDRRARVARILRNRRERPRTAEIADDRDNQILRLHVLEKPEMCLRSPGSFAAAPAHRPSTSGTHRSDAGCSGPVQSADSRDPDRRQRTPCDRCRQCPRGPRPRAAAVVSWSAIQ